MKKIFIVTCFVLASYLSFGAGFIAELRLSIKRAQEGNLVEYTMHYASGDSTIIDASNFDKGLVIMSNNDQPLYMELFKGQGDEKQNIAISLQNANYYKLDIKKVDGKWEYRFHFYY